MLPLLFLAGKSYDKINTFYNYAKWNIPFRLVMLCSNFILLSTLIQLKLLENIDGEYISDNIASFVLMGVTILIYTFLLIKSIVFIVF